MAAPASSRQVVLGLLGSLALALALVTFTGLQMVSDVRQGGTVMGQDLMVLPAQQTTELKAVWRKLRNEPMDFYPDRIWLYAGKETALWGRGKLIGDLKALLRYGHYETQVMTFTSIDIAPVRAVCWDKHTHVIVFPPFDEYPDLHQIARTDLRHYVSTGNNLVFLGGFATMGLMNDIFGFRLKAEVYQEGPFYRSPRYAPGTIFETLPDRIGEIGQIYGTKIGSLPPGARSYYDTLGDSVVWSVRYGFGMLTYVGNNMMQAFEMGPWHKVLRAAVAI